MRMWLWMSLSNFSSMKFRQLTSSFAVETPFGSLLHRKIVEFRVKNSLVAMLLKSVVFEVSEPKNPLGLHGERNPSNRVGHACVLTSGNTRIPTHPKNRRYRSDGWTVLLVVYFRH